MTSQPDAFIVDLLRNLWRSCLHNQQGPEHVGLFWYSSNTWMFLYITMIFLYLLKNVPPLDLVEVPGLQWDNSSTPLPTQPPHPIAAALPAVPLGAATGELFSLSP